MENSSVYLGGFQTPNTVLIVSGDENNRKILREMNSEFYIVEEIPNVQNGIAEIQKDSSRFCAILLDVLTPETDGMELLRGLKEEGILQKVPTFLLAEDPAQTVMQEVYGLGVRDVLDKPVIPFVALRRVLAAVELFAVRKKLDIAMENRQMQLLEKAERVIRLNQGMIEALATAIEFRNQESVGHVQRICLFTKIMLENTEFGVGLDAEEIDNIALAAILHDVGKITIPDSILTKPGKLTSEEFEIIKRHTTWGVDLLESIPQIRDSGIYKYACDIVRHHHERWDGFGYPDGLRGEQISPWAQVVSLADVYDALSCKRVYKPSLPREQVLEMIHTGQCGLFSPRLLKNFFTVENQIYALYRQGPEEDG